MKHVMRCVECAIGFMGLTLALVRGSMPEAWLVASKHILFRLAYWDMAEVVQDRQNLAEATELIQRLELVREECSPLARLIFRSKTKFIKPRNHETACTASATKQLTGMKEQIDALAAQLWRLTTTTRPKPIEYLDIMQRKEVNYEHH